jgi:type III pantothenate kinase
MTPDVVADVGNSRIKWGLCRGWRVVATTAVPHSDPEAWQKQLEAWNLAGPLTWAIAGTHPQRRDALADWLQPQGHQVTVLTDWQKLPIPVAVDKPDRVGIDRLLNAVAFKHKGRREVSGIVIDAGSAVTVDWVDGAGTFHGGAIFPGLRLMSQALHAYTAKLPLVEVTDPLPPVPGLNTTAAIRAGVYWAVVGGIRALVQQTAERIPAHRYPDVYLTGGDSALLAPAFDDTVHVWPEMTLEGIRLAAEALP